MGGCTSMNHRVLITGGAGFIGSHVTDELLRHGWTVRLLDNLSPQVHGESRTPPSWLHPGAELMVGEVALGPASGRLPIGPEELAIGQVTAAEIGWIAAPDAAR